MFSSRLLRSTGKSCSFLESQVIPFIKLIFGTLNAQAAMHLRFADDYRLGQHNDKKYLRMLKKQGAVSIVTARLLLCAH